MPQRIRPLRARHASRELAPAADAGTQLADSRETAARLLTGPFPRIDYEIGIEIA